MQQRTVLNGIKSSYEGTYVYVDERNVNPSPDGKIDNPFVDLQSALDSLAGKEGLCVVEVISSGSSALQGEVKNTSLVLKGQMDKNSPGLEISITSEMDQLIVTDFASSGLNITLSERIDTLRINNVQGDFYEGAQIYITAQEEAYISTFTMNSLIANINLQGQFGTTTIANSALGNIMMQGTFSYTPYFNNCSISNGITLYSEESDVSVMFIGCDISSIDGGSEEHPLYINLKNSRIVREPMGNVVLQDESPYVQYQPVNYSLEEYSQGNIIDHLKAIDIKLGELQS